MHNRLSIEFDAEASSFKSVSRLLDSEIQEIQLLICQKFDVKLNNVWCWENLLIQNRTIEYGNEDGLNKIKQLLNADPIVRLIVTDEEGAPSWFGFKGKLFELLEVVKRLRYFEFFIVSESCKWIVFDTHYNALIVCGELV